MTSLPDNPVLEFIIKSYPDAGNPKHDGMTEHLGRDIEVGDRVLFGDAYLDGLLTPSLSCNRPSDVS